MSKGYEIPLSMPGADEAIKKLEELQQKIEQTNATANRARSSARTSSDPWSRLNEANSRYERMKGMGLSDEELRVTRLEQIRAQRAADRANRDLNPQANDPMKTMFMRTRLRIGPWNPLVGDLVKNGLIDESKIDSMMARISGSKAAQAATARLAGAAIPLLAQAAGAGLIGTVVSAGIAVGRKAFESTDGAAGRARDKAGAFWIGGGGMYADQAMATARFFGMDSTTMANRAVEFGDKLRGGGYGAAVMREKGIVDFGDRTDRKFDNLIKALDLLRKMPEQQARRVARNLGITDMMKAYDLSDQSWEKLKRSREGATSEASRRRIAEADASGERLSNAIGNIWDPFATRMRNQIARYLENPISGGMQNAFDNSLPGMIYNGFYGDKTGYRTNGVQGVKANETRELTNAIKDFGRSVKDAAEMIGGGRRAKSAISAGTKALNFQDAAIAQSMGLGAFTVG